MGKSVLQIDLPSLRRMLQLPENCHILAIVPDLLNKRLDLLLESEALPETADNQPYPLAQAIHTVESHPEQPEFRKLSVHVEVQVPPADAPALIDQL